MSSLSLTGAPLAPLRPAGAPPYLGSPLELVHGGVVGRLAGSTLGSTDEI